MQAVGIILLLISIGTIAGPMGAVVIMYRDNLAGLVITPQIRDIMNGNSALIPSGKNANDNINNNNLNTNDNGSSVAGGLITPVFVGAQVDSSSRTFTVTVNVTNNFGYDFTVNGLNATVESSQDHYLLGTVSLANPITIPAGETRIVNQRQDRAAGVAFCRGWAGLVV